MILKNILKKVLGTNFNLYYKEFLERFSPMKRRASIERRIFYSKFINKNDLCFDIGANVGNRVTPLLKIGAKIIAVEPQKSCYKILRRKFGNKITIITKGLCEKECVRKFHISNETTTSSFSDEWINSVKTNRFKELNWDKTIDVEMTTLDNLIIQHGTPTFIKIDVEGYELEVLKGLTKPIHMISFEYTVPEQINKIKECIAVIENNNSNILCNYSIEESMEWKLKNWITIPEFLEHIKESNFIKTGYGDVYLKYMPS